MWLCNGVFCNDVSFTHVILILSCTLNCATSHDQGQMF